MTRRSPSRAPCQKGLQGSCVGAAPLEPAPRPPHPASLGGCSTSPGAGPQCPSGGRLTHPLPPPLPQDTASFTWPCWEGCGTNLLAPGQGRSPGPWGAAWHLGTRLPQRRERSSPASPGPSWVVSPTLCGHSSKKRDGAGGRGGRAAPQMRGALPAGARKPRSPHLPHPRLTVPRVGFPVLSGSHRALSPSSQPVPPQGPGRPAAGCPGGLRALGDARQYVWGVRMKSRSSSLRIHFMSLLTALMAPALVPRGL